MNKPKKSYPPFYEKFVPIAISVLAFVIVVVLFFTLAVGFGVFKFG